MRGSYGLGDPRIVVLGGGTGSFVVLSALKKLTANCTAIVNMCDDGGSTGVLRDELGVLPPGDARQCLVALSESPDMRDVFNYRFEAGGLAGQSLGNIILSGLELQQGSFEKAVEVASRVLRLRGKVCPVVLGDHKLVMRDGETEIVGEHSIDMHQIVTKDARVRLEPRTVLNPAAEKAIAEADLVVIAPGSLYTSLLPIFSVNGMAQALQQTEAQVVMVASLVNKPTQTPDWHVVDYVRKVEEYIGDGVVDTVLYNGTDIPTELLEKYAEADEHPIGCEPERFAEIAATPVQAGLVSSTISVQNPADTAIRRTLIRHDTSRLADEVASLLSVGR